MSGNHKPTGGLQRVLGAIDRGDALYVDPIRDFEAACDHIVALLTDAGNLFQRGSYATSAFLAIIAIEEVAKAHVGIYRRGKRKENSGRDPLRDHTAKQSMASLPTVYMGARLVDALGAETCRRLEGEAEAGFNTTREACLYMDRKDGVFTTPAQAIVMDRARELLLLAVEAADDALVGYSSHSYKSREALDYLFARIASAVHETK